MKQVAPFIDQVKVLSEVFTEQDTAIQELKKSQDDRYRKNVEAMIKRKVDLAVNKLSLKVESLEIKFATANNLPTSMDTKQQAL